MQNVDLRELALSLLLQQQTGGQRNAGPGGVANLVHSALINNGVGALNPPSVAVSAPQPAAAMTETRRETNPARADSDSAAAVRALKAQTERAAATMKHKSGASVDGTCAPTGESGGNLPITVACKARGLPLDHNFKTAFFEIPPGVKHGDHLVCSYPACRDNGVKFVWCTKCDEPVAKRTFRSLHHHTDDDAPSKVPSASVPSPAKREVSKPAAKRDSAACKASPLPENTRPTDRYDPSRRMIWSRLLDERPNQMQGQEIMDWLVKVVAVSDPDVGYNQEVTSSDSRANTKSGTTTEDSNDGSSNDTSSSSSEYGSGEKDFRSGEIDNYASSKRTSQSVGVDDQSSGKKKRRVR